MFGIFNYTNRDSLLNNLYKYVGDNEILLNIITTDNLWILVFAQYILLYNYGIFNESLRNIFENIIISISSLYAGDNHDKDSTNKVLETIIEKKLQVSYKGKYYALNIPDSIKTIYEKLSDKNKKYNTTNFVSIEISTNRNLDLTKEGLLDAITIGDDLPNWRFTLYMDTSINDLNNLSQFNTLFQYALAYRINNGRLMIDSEYVKPSRTVKFTYNNDWYKEIEDYYSKTFLYDSDDNVKTDVKNAYRLGNNINLNDYVIGIKEDKIIDDSQLDLAYKKELQIFSDIFDNPDYTKDMLLGGDLYAIDNKELLKRNAENTTILANIFEAPINNLEVLIKAYYANILTNFNAYFDKTIFTEILYNSIITHKFFKDFAKRVKSIHKNPSDKEKVLLELIDYTKSVFNRDNDKMILKVNDIVNNYDKYIYNNTSITNEGILQPTTIRKFLNLCYDPITGTNKEIKSNGVVTNYLIDYITKAQGDNLIKMLLDIEKLNLANGAVLMYLKEFKLTTTDELVGVTKYTDDYVENEPFDGEL